MTCPEVQRLPEWLEYAKVFSTPFVALIAAGIAASIAYQQMKTAKEKLKLDLFDKRYEAYKVVEAMLKAALEKRDVRVEDMAPFFSVVGEAEWLLDADLKTYLSTELKDGVLSYIQTNNASQQYQRPAERLYPNPEQIAEIRALSEAWGEKRQWLYLQLTDLPNRFAKDMKINA